MNNNGIKSKAPNTRYFNEYIYQYVNDLFKFQIFAILVWHVIRHCCTFSLLSLNKNNIGSFVHIFDFTSVSLNTAITVTVILLLH